MHKYLLIIFIGTVIVGTETYLRYKDYQLIRSQQQKIELFSDRIDLLEQLIDRNKISSHPDSKKEEMLSKEIAQLRSKTERLAAQVETLSLASISKDLTKSETLTEGPLIDVDELRVSIAEVLNEMVMQQQNNPGGGYNQFESLSDSGRSIKKENHYQAVHLANTLSLNESQELAYQQLLEQYQVELSTSNPLVDVDQHIDGADEDDIQVHFEDQLLQQADILQNFNEDFMALLDEQQIERFIKLPPDEKAVLGQRFMTKSDFSERER